MAGAEAPNHTKIQLVDGNADFCTDNLTQFVSDAKLAERKTDYQVVAIMGPQSSGKSTLLNHVVRFEGPMGHVHVKCARTPPNSPTSHPGQCGQTQLAWRAVIRAVWHQLCDDGRHERAQPDHQGARACGVGAGVAGPGPRRASAAACVQISLPSSRHQQRQAGGCSGPLCAVSMADRL